MGNKSTTAPGPPAPNMLAYHCLNCDYYITPDGTRAFPVCQTCGKPLRAIQPDSRDHNPSMVKR